MSVLSPSLCFFGGTVVGMLNGTADVDVDTSSRTGPGTRFVVDDDVVVSVVDVVRSDVVTAGSVVVVGGSEVVGIVISCVVVVDSVVVVDVVNWARAGAGYARRSNATAGAAAHQKRCMRPDVRGSDLMPTMQPPQLGGRERPGRPGRVGAGPPQHLVGGQIADHRNVTRSHAGSSRTLE